MQAGLQSPTDARWYLATRNFLPLCLAFLSAGPVVVLASVAGPLEVRLRDELVDRAAFEINIKPVRGLPGPSTKAIVDSLDSILKPVLLLNRYPRALVQLSLQTISLPSTRYSKPFRSFVESASNVDNDQEQTIDEDLAATEAQPESVSEKAVAINASVCSLVDSAIGLKAMICAVGLAILLPSVEASDDQRIILDPSAEEERDAQATLCVAFAYGQDGGGLDGDVCYFDMSKGFIEDEQVSHTTIASSTSIF